MKDALTQRCLTQKQLGRFLSKTGTQRFNNSVIQHVEHCDTCWQMIEPHLRRKKESAGPLMDRFFPEQRPRTRADCKDGARPCPWIGCRHHLLNDEHDDVPARVLSLPVIGEHSCVLDVVEEGRELTPTEIGRLIKRRPEEVSANLESALRKCEEAGVFAQSDADVDESPDLWGSIMEGA